MIKLIKKLINKLKKSEPKFISVFSCINCNSILSNFERVHSRGICPYCGYHSRGTICSCVKKSIQK